jgi:hypothetical protein
MFVNLATEVTDWLQLKNQRPVEAEARWKGVHAFYFAMPSGCKGIERSHFADGIGRARAEKKQKKHHEGAKAEALTRFDAGEMPEDD